VLQEGEFERVGGSHTLTVNVRVIAATNRDLATAVQAVSFHADLFYRLNVFPLLLPPLRERKDDIPLLVKCFLARMAKKLRKALTGLSDESMARVMCYSWSGNVGELHNVIERAAILARGPIVEIDDALEQRLPPSDDTLPATSLQDVERAHIIRVLAEAHGIIEGPRGTARILGLHPNMLRFRLQKLGTTHSRRRLWSSSWLRAMAMDCPGEVSMWATTSRSWCNARRRCSDSISMSWGFATRDRGSKRAITSSRGSLCLRLDRRSLLC
jgi:transcriptional regulator with GAF, ATPase, and Fis domain